MSKNIIKTNVMRILDKYKIEYEFFDNTACDSTVGTVLAEYMGVDKKCVFKTLVTIGHSKEHYVFMIPVADELDLKKAAKAVSEKNIEMIKSKELFMLTGYIHGGCSPIGMKKQFTTIVDESYKNLDYVYFSAGKVGCQIKLHSSDLMKVIDITFADVVV